ncbi:MAG: hypothetical protein PF693_01180 [Spirochaetia bacterium]|jgi:ribonuclease BN (tRNA processing enzyme)|nr:hypothetical protein [Spirochaetia bacterium]
MQPKFAVKYLELNSKESVWIDIYKITAIDARHTVTTKPLALKIETDKKTIAYTGDGELTEDLINFTDKVDLLIAECYYFDKAVKWHLNYPDIQHLRAGKIILTHMHENMLAHKDEVPEVCANDGMVVSLN